MHQCAIAVPMAVTIEIQHDELITSN